MIPTLAAGMSFVTHLESAIDGTRLRHDQIQTMHEGRPLWVRYDLDAIAAQTRRDDLLSRSPSLWRYEELLPIDHVNAVTLGEGMTPITEVRPPRGAVGSDESLDQG